MGNIQETANFFKYNGDTGVMMETVCNRSDILHFRTQSNIELKAVGICSPISKKADACLRIYDTSTQRELISQQISLVPSRLTPHRFYDLLFPVEIFKDRFYTINIEVSGGATHTYAETNESSRHNYFEIEITRELPYKFTKSFKERINLSREKTTDSSPHLSAKSTIDTFLMPNISYRSSKVATRTAEGGGREGSMTPKYRTNARSFSRNLVTTSKDIRMIRKVETYNPSLFAEARGKGNFVHAAG